MKPAPAGKRARAPAARTPRATEAERKEMAAIAERMDRAVAALHSASRRFWFYHHHLHGEAGRTMRLHVALARAIASGDPNRAGQTSDRLIDDLFDFVRGTLIAP